MCVGVLFFRYEVKSGNGTNAIDNGTFSSPRNHLKNWEVEFAIGKYVVALIKKGSGQKV